MMRVANVKDGFMQFQSLFTLLTLIVSYFLHFQTLSYYIDFDPILLVMIYAVYMYFLFY